MATAYWSGNSQNVSQVVTLTVTAAGAAGDTVYATINGKSVTYTTVTGDTTATAAAAWQALLAGTTAPPEFGEITWTVSANVVTATATSPGTPFTLTSGSTGAATVAQATAQASVSSSDVGLAANWLRSGSAALPQNGDDVVLADSSVPLLWNLTALAAVQFATFTRWQSFTGTVGLPENNPRGYREYRPTYFQFAGPAGTLPLLLGQGDTGSGPARERYDVGSQRTALTVLASGGAADDYAVRFLGTNANNTVAVAGTSVGVAMLPAEVSTLASAAVGAGGTLALGAGVTFSGTLTVTGGQATVNCAPAALVAQQGSQVTVAGTGLTYAAVTALNGSRLGWSASGTLTTLTLQTGAVLDKSADARALTVTNSTVDGDSCQVLDPYSSITWTNATAVRGGSFAGPFTFAAGRTVKIA